MNVLCSYGIIGQIIEEALPKCQDTLTILREKELLYIPVFLLTFDKYQHLVYYLDGTMRMEHLSARSATIQLSARRAQKREEFTMHYLSDVNYVLEALSYLGLRTNESYQQNLEERFYSRGGRDIESFRVLYAPYQALRSRLDSIVTISQLTLAPLFADLKDSRGSGGYSAPAAMLLMPVACGCAGDFESFSKAVAAMTPDQAAENILISLDYSAPAFSRKNAQAILMEHILLMEIPADRRAQLLSVHRDYREITRQALPCVRQAYDALLSLSDELARLTAPLTRRIAEVGSEACLHEISSFTADQGVGVLRPLITDPTANLFLRAPCAKRSPIYCGVLRPPLRYLHLSAQMTRDQVYSCIRLLGDQTRFNILCYLHNHPAYGQELSSQFGLARNTIHHHMSQLLKAGLVTCTVEGTRTYYSIDQEHFSRLIEQQKHIFLDT